MAQLKNKNQPEVPFMSRPEVGTAFTIAAGLAFLLTGMLLPLVGKAGAKVSHYTANYMAFFTVLVITLVLSGLATHSKIKRRKVDASPLPKLSIAIFGSSLLLLISLFLGLLKI